MSERQVRTPPRDETPAEKLDRHWAELLQEVRVVQTGVQLLTAQDGEEALGVVEVHHPELVFLDVMMPRKNGFEVCRAIKRERGLEATKVVLLTAKGQQVDREEGLAAGADRYLTKPFDPDELLAMARELLGAGA